MEENQRNEKICDICKSKATLLCLECICSYYCDNCYKLIHDIKVNSNHKKENVDYFVPIETRCSEHPNVALNLFCLDEKGNNNIIFILTHSTLLFNVPFFESS